MMMQQLSECVCRKCPSRIRFGCSRYIEQCLESKDCRSCRETLDVCPKDLPY